MNNLFWGIPISQKDKIHEHIQKSVLLGRRTKGHLVCCFHSSLQVFERAFLQKSHISTGSKSRLKPGKLLNLIGHNGKKQDSFQYHCIDIQGSGFFKRQAFF